MEEFFDAQYLVRNIASLFGIPADRMKVPKIVAGSLQVDAEIVKEDGCKSLVCGTNGVCNDDTGTPVCVCNAGYETPGDCEGGDCTCSKQSCASDCLTCSANGAPSWSSRAMSMS